MMFYLSGNYDWQLVSLQLANPFNLPRLHQTSRKPVWQYKVPIDIEIYRRESLMSSALEVKT